MSRSSRISKPRLSHPLSGADPFTLFDVLVRGRGVAANRLPHLAVVLGSVIGRLPVSAIERVYVATRRRRAGADQPPIFIVGHWRSGTTHLYNLLSRADYGFVPPVAAGLPWDFLTLGAMLGPVLRRLMPETRYIDNIPVRPDSPQEDEIGLANMSARSFYHALYFPRQFERFFDHGLFLDDCTPSQIAAWQRRFRHFLRKLAIHHAGRRIVLKNPVYTARVGMLREMLPDAKFIHIHRHPIDVFFSMRHFYARLFEALALQPYDHVDVDDVILRTYPRMMERLQVDARPLPPDRFVEIGYDQLVGDPIGTLARVYRQLDLPDFDAHRPGFESHLNSVRDYQKNRFGHDAETVAMVEAAWQPAFVRYGYPLISQRAGAA